MPLPPPPCRPSTPTIYDIPVEKQLTSSPLTRTVSCRACKQRRTVRRLSASTARETLGSSSTPAKTVTPPAIRVEAMTLLTACLLVVLFVQVHF